MTDAAYMDSGDSYDDLDLDGFESDDLDELGLDELDTLDAAQVDDLDEQDAFELDEYDDELDALDEGEDGLDMLAELDGDELDGLDEAADYAYDTDAGLFLPGRPALITGPAATAIARTLNPAVLDSLDADDADAFLRRISRGVRQVAGRLARGARRVGGQVMRGARTLARQAGPALRAAAPMLRRVLPMVQRVAGLAGPWGRLVSAGIGGVQGLMSGRGLQGALQGAVGGLLPGGLGQAVGRVLGGGDGMDDDAALDALADMADAGEIDAAVALPLGAGLASRLIARQGMGRALMRSGALPGRMRGVLPLIQRLERMLLSAGRRIPGPPGRRLRVLRGAARSAVARIARQAPTPRQAVRALPVATQAAVRRAVPRAVQNPRVGSRAPAVAARRVAQRRRVLRRVPADRLFGGQTMAPAPA